MNTRNINNKSITNDFSRLEQERKQLENDLKQIEERRKQLEQSRIQAMDAKIKEFPSILGVNGLDEVIGLIKQAANGTLNKIRASANDLRVRLTDSQRDEITEKLLAGNPPRELADEYNVSLSTIQIIKNKAGLVKRRSGLRAARA